MSEITAWQAIPSNARTLLVCLAACIFSLGTAYLLRFQLSAFAVFCFCLAACLIAFSRRTTAGGFFVYNFAFVFIALGLFELYLTVYPSNNYHEGTYADGTYFVDDADLGYALARRERIVERILKSAAGMVVYDVRYSINSYGLRKTSLKAEDSIGGKSIFFFGDSFAFGEGVNDADTLPQQFYLETGIRTVNFGVHGYGSHQVLRQLEINRPRTVEPRDPLAIVYILLPSHVFRPAGRANWDPNGPHYEYFDGDLKYLDLMQGLVYLTGRRY